MTTMQTRLSNITAAVLAGGLGTRLRSVVPDRPKVLAEVAGRPFLSFLLDRLVGAGIRHAVLCTGYQAELVQAAFGERYGELHLEYSVESSPVGTGGALRQALPLLRSPTILVANGDSWCDAPLPALLESHQRTAACGSLLLAHVADASRYGRVQTDDYGRITRFAEKSSFASPGWINAGVYTFQRELLESIPAGQPMSLERELFPAWLDRGLYGFRADGRFIDIGTPESFTQAGQFVSASDFAPAL